MVIEGVITALGMLAAAAAVYFVKRASSTAVHDVEPDPKRVKRFVESAPLDRLKNIQIS